MTSGEKHCEHGSSNLLTELMVEEGLDRVRRCTERHPVGFVQLECFVSRLRHFEMIPGRK
jgi:hypothetical protein